MVDDKKNNWVGRLVIHQHENDYWRLRNIKDHPIDPNWETGTYCKCHQKMRQIFQKGKWIFDVVWIPQGVFPHARSAFKIKFIEGETLHYVEYWFNDGKPLEITPAIVSSIKPYTYRTSTGKILTQDDCKNLLIAFKKNSFHKYKKGEKPESITVKDWARMTREAKKSLRKRHRCSFDKKLFIPIRTISRKKF